MNLKNIKRLNIVVGGVDFTWFLSLFFMESVFGERCLIANTACDQVHNVLLQFSGIWTLLLLPFFLFSIITYFMKDSVSKSWIYFSYVWLPISVFTILSSDNTKNGGGWGLLDFSTAAVVFVVTMLLYILISLLIIIYKYIATRGKGR